MHLIKIFEDISNDFEKVQYRSSKVLSRKFVLNSGCDILVNLHKKNRLMEIGFVLPESYNINELKDLPKWKGMEQRVSSIIEDGTYKQFLFFSQLPEYEPHIFIVVMGDIVDKLDLCDDLKKIINIIKILLTKWNNFFQNDKEVIMSDNKQQGLYSELYILEKLLSIKGDSTIHCWTGCNAEIHDFYIDKDALEVKSSSIKGPDRVSISNENQLDDTGILGKLFMIYVKVKKSTVDGESLQDIINRIVHKIGVTNKNDFIEKLFKVGYIYQCPELYTFRFKIMDESCYEIKDGFPRIIPQNLNKGIGSVEYILSLDACAQYQVPIETFYKGVKKSDNLSNETI